MNKSPTALTESQFSDAQDKVDDLIRAARRWTQEQRDAAAAVSAEWEAAIALSDRTFDARKARLAAILAVAVKHSLVTVNS